MKIIYNRQKKILEGDEQYGEKYLNFLYNTLLGRILLMLIISPVFSKINALYNKTFFSKNKIKKFIEKYKIDINDFDKTSYNSFDEFFIRKKKQISYNKEANILISPADSKLIAYKIDNDLKIKIKQSIYTINELLCEDINLNDYKQGNCLVFRLSVDDYHRYCYVDDGEMKKVKKINGCLHTISSISKDYKVYSQNTRICNYISTKNFDDIIFIEVGALLVGKINNYQQPTFHKGEEKGYFELGGSTIVIITKDNLKIDDDIFKYSQEGIETKVKYGERIGELKC